MKELARNTAIGKIHVLPGDTLKAYYGPPGGDREVGRFEITRPMVVDTLVIVEIEPGEMGLADGIGAIFGVAAK